jgi:putative DNA primase/helicase
MSHRHLSAVADIEETAHAFAFSDSGNVDYFEREVDRRLAFDNTAKRFYLFGEHHWRVDTLQHVQEMALEAMRARQHEATHIVDKDARKAALAWSLRSEDRRRIIDLLALAQSRPTIAVDGSEWDRAPMLWGVQNGVIDLERAALRPGCTMDRITKVSPIVFVPDARCPRFERFLREIFRSAPEVVPWLQRVLGYAMTGLTSEQAFWIWWGSGMGSRHCCRFSCNPSSG